MSKQRKMPTEKPAGCKDKRLLGPVAIIFDSTPTGSWRIVRPVVDYAACTKCGTCEKFCPTNVIEIKKDAVTCVDIDWNYCKGCGICADVCVKKCIAMKDECSE